MDRRRKRRWLCAEETVERGRSTQGPGVYVGQVSCFTAAGGEGKESESSWDARVVFGGRRRELGDRADAGEGGGTSPNEAAGRAHAWAPTKHRFAGAVDGGRHTLARPCTCLPTDAVKDSPCGSADTAAPVRWKLPRCSSPSTPWPCGFRFRPVKPASSLLAIGVCERAWEWRPGKPG